MNTIVVPEGHLPTLLQKHVVARYSNGQVLFYAGHHPQGLWVLVSGHVLLKSASGRRRQVAGPAILGWEELQSHRPYDASAIVETSCKVAFFTLQEISDCAAFIASL